MVCLAQGAGQDPARHCAQLSTIGRHVVLGSTPAHVATLHALPAVSRFTPPNLTQISLPFPFPPLLVILQMQRGGRGVTGGDNELVPLPMRRSIAGAAARFVATACLFVQAGRSAAPSLVITTA